MPTTVETPKKVIHIELYEYGTLLEMDGRDGYETEQLLELVSILNEPRSLDIIKKLTEWVR